MYLFAFLPLLSFVLSHESHGSDEPHESLKPSATATAAASATPSLKVPSAVIKELGTKPGYETSKILAAVVSLGLVGFVDSLTNSTLFIPIDKAFEGVDLNAFSANQLKAIITYHVAPGVYYSSSLKTTQIPSALNGQLLNVTVDASGVKINTAKVVLADTPTTAGVIHLIDKLLVPPVIPPKDNSTQIGNGSMTLASSAVAFVIVLFSLMI